MTPGTTAQSLTGDTSAHGTEQGGFDRTSDGFARHLANEDADIREGMRADRANEPWCPEHGYGCEPSNCPCGHRSAATAGTSPMNADLRRNRPELFAPHCDHDGCHASAMLVTSHGRRLCGNPAHIATADGERIMWQVGTGSRPPAEWWLS